MTKIFSDYAKYYNLMYQTKDYKQEADFVYNWANKPKTILDLGTGTAKHWEYLPVKIIIGIEKSKNMINKSPYKKFIINMDISKISNLRNICPKCLKNHLQNLPNLSRKLK